MTLDSSVVVLMEAIEEREDLIFWQKTRDASDEQVMRCREELTTLRKRLNVKTNYAYTKDGYGSGAVWTEKTGKTIYQAVHDDCPDCGSYVVTFETEKERDDFIAAKKSEGGTMWFDARETEITRVVRRVE